MEAQAPPPASLYGDRECFGLIALWVAVWLVAHHLLWVLWQRGRVPLLPRETIDRYRRRLCRSQAYCALAVVGAAHLLSQCRWSAEDLLHLYSADHQFLFAMAIGHWLVAIWEDAQCTAFLGAGMSTELTRQSAADMGEIFGKMYLVHHVVAGAGFAAVLFQRSCTGIGAFGLLFELPVLLMNHREFGVCMSPRPRWFYDLQELNRFWNKLTVCFVFGRATPTVVYVYSIIFWQEDINKMPYREIVTYHFMALFFTGLNYGLNMYLGSWRKSDRMEARKYIAERAAAEGDTSFLEEHVVIGGELFDEDRGKKGNDEGKLCEIPEEEFQTRGEEFGQIWIEIDGIAYDVTKFLTQHPGGEASLRTYASRDASEAFHRVRHSMRAKLMMQQFVVGAIVRRPRAYRIFEHHEAMVKVLLAGIQYAFTSVVLSLLLPRSLCGQLAASPGPGATWAALLTPGLFLSGGIGGAVLVMAFLSGTFRVSCMASVVAVCLMALSTGLLLARRPLPTNVPEVCPTGIEMGAAVLLTLEELADLCLQRRHWSWNVLLAAGVGGTGFVLRGAGGLFADGAEHLAAALLIGGGAFLVVRVAGDFRDREVINSDILSGVALAGLYSGLALLGLDAVGPEPARIWAAFAGASWWTLLGCFPSALFAAFMVRRMMEQAYMFCPSWSARCMAQCMWLASIIMGNSLSWCLVSAFAWFAHNASVAQRYRREHDAKIAAGTFAEEVPPFVLGTRSLWDTFRAASCAFAWAIVQLPLRVLVNRILPEELAVWAIAMPIFDLGGGVDYGIAAYAAPPGAQRVKEAPRHFVCSVRHVCTSTGEGVRDLQRRTNQLRDSWRRARGRGAPEGLLANVVCLFSSVGERRLSKEIQLSCWATEEEARDWLGRCQVIEQQGGGATLSAQAATGELDMHLQPRGHVRHQDRCTSCFRLVESDQIGARAPGKCGACGRKARGYYFF